MDQRQPRHRRHTAGRAEVQPQPPNAEQAARIVAEAWADPDWGALIWCTMTTGARRGELCAVRWSRVDLTPSSESMWLTAAIRKVDGEWVEAPLKSHQERRVALDPETALVLREHHERCRRSAEALGLNLEPEAFVFSNEPDGRAFRNPGGLTQRYDRLAERLGIETTFHKLRHYSAIELIKAGVDIHTVAGRLGHGGGGATTLRFYTAWVSEVDQRASLSLHSRMPERPPLRPMERVLQDPKSPYERIAAELLRQVINGELAVGSHLPTVKEIARIHEVGEGTAHRTTALLKEWGVIEATRGRRATVVAQPIVSTTTPELTPASDPQSNAESRAVLLNLRLQKAGNTVSTFTAKADPNDADKLEHLLLGATRRLDADPAEIDLYEQEVRRHGSDTLLTTFVTSVS